MTSVKPGTQAINRSSNSGPVLGADNKHYAMGSWAEQRIAGHLVLRADGLTVREIAARTGWSYATVWRDITRYRLVSRGANEPRETLPRTSSRWSNRQIAAIAGVSHETVNRASRRKEANRP